MSSKKYLSPCPSCGATFMRFRRAFGRMCKKCCIRNITHRNGPLNPRWSGGRFYDKKGYVLVYSPNHPRAHNKHVLEHILIAERMLNRSLMSNEIVHHVNGIKSDNRPENLHIMDRAEHTKYHFPKRKKTMCSGGCGIGRFCVEGFLCKNCRRPSFNRVKSAYDRLLSWRMVGVELGISHETARKIYGHMV